MRMNHLQSYENLSSQSKSTMSEDVYKDLQDKLEKFEKKNNSLKKELH